MLAGTIARSVGDGRCLVDRMLSDGLEVTGEGLVDDQERQAGEPDDEDRQDDASDDLRERPLALVQIPGNPVCPGRDAHGLARSIRFIAPSSAAWASAGRRRADWSEAEAMGGL